MRSQHPIVSHHLPSKILIFWYPKCSDIAVLIDVWVFSRGVSLATGTQISRHQDLLDRAFGWRDKNKQIARCFLRSGTPQGTWIRLFVASECIWWVLRNPNSRKKSHLPNGFKSFLPVCVYWVHWDMFNPLRVSISTGVTCGHHLQIHAICLPISSSRGQFDATNGMVIPNGTFWKAENWNPQANAFAWWFTKQGARAGPSCDVLEEEMSYGRSFHHWLGPKFNQRPQ